MLQLVSQKQARAHPRMWEEIMVAGTIALVFKAIYWGFLLSLAAIFIGCFARGVLEEAQHDRRSWLRRLQNYWLRFR